MRYYLLFVRNCLIIFRKHDFVVKICGFTFNEWFPKLPKILKR